MIIKIGGNRMSQRIIKLVILCVFVGMIGAYVGGHHEPILPPKLPADVDAWLKQVEIGPLPTC